MEPACHARDLEGISPRREDKRIKREKQRCNARLAWVMSGRKIKGPRRSVWEREGLIFVKDLLVIVHHLLGVLGIAVAAPAQAGFHPRAEVPGVGLGIAVVPDEGPSDIAVAEIVPLNG